MIATLKNKLTASRDLIPRFSWGMINPMKAFLEARKKIFGLAVIVVLILLMMNLNSRLADFFRLSSERDKMAAHVAQLQLTKMALETQVAYATSDQAVEDWARNEAHMAKPGDKVVVQITPAFTTITPEVVVTPAPRPVENWEVWWALFFGE